MPDLPIAFADPALQARLRLVADPESRILAAIEAVAPLWERTVRMADPTDDLRRSQLSAAGARVGVPGSDDAVTAATTTIAFWPLSDARPSGGLEVTDDPRRAVEALVATAGDGGQVIAVEDYGRDDLSLLIGGPSRADRLTGLSRGDGPYLGQGFRIRVLHCWWRWADLDDACAFLEAAFGAPGLAVGRALKHPRLAWNVAIFHRGPRAGAS